MAAKAIIEKTTALIFASIILVIASSNKDLFYINTILQFFLKPSFRF